MAIISGFQSGGGSDTQVTPPTVTIGEYLYDGTSQGPTITGFDSNTMVLTGTTTAINGGSYTFTIALKNPKTMCWADTGYNNPLVYEWEIAGLIYGIESSDVLGQFSRTDGASNFTDPNPYYSGMSGNPSSPFDNISPWKDIKIVEDSDLGTLVEIPKFWYKWTKNGTAMKLQISSQPFSGALVSPAHADRGDGQGERDFVYTGRYHCDSNYKSTTGVKPKVSITRATARTSIANLKTGAYQNDYAMFWTIRMLYLVEFAHYDSQNKIGYGCGGGSATGNMGYTDSMPYHTGTTQSSRATYGLGTQYRYIEGLWDNVNDWCDGINYEGAKFYIINNPNNFSDTNGILIGSLQTTSISTSKSYTIQEWGIPGIGNDYTWALYPLVLYQESSTFSHYTCDQVYIYNGKATRVGGASNNLGYGLFYIAFSSDNTSNYCGARLMYLPQNS